ncbi:MAG TPA: FliA/WhiG family RNA polymerase sigma factor [Pseudobdellovibrionaceae bacterium]|mgnify:CR=1 FL=1|nr:FliA/WhiG family RNA polymerase sigma factor [Pseudobdellovibrionaceae bacterium]
MAKNSALVKKYQDFPKKITAKHKDKLIREYSPLIKFVAQKIAARLPSNIELDDLISAGVIGLMDAIDKYDSTRDNKFKTYAEFRIRGAILDELRAQDWVPRSIRDKAKALDRTIVQLEATLGRSATDEEIAQKLELTVDEFYSLVNQVKPVSLLPIEQSNDYNNTDKKSILDILEGSKSANPHNQLDYKLVQNVMAKAIEELPERQRMVLSLYYYEEMSLKEIGQVLQVTESRVSQLHAQAVVRLRARISTTLGSMEGEIL